MGRHNKGSAPPKAREAARAGATSQKQVIVGNRNGRQDKANARSPQAVAEMIRTARAAARANMVRSLSSEGADAFAALCLGRHHARRAERLAMFSEVQL